jgi:prepilin-type N-terminal cleavage/methylation domain-containing protein
MMKGLMKRIGGFELSFTKKLHRGQKGFTLMELLIVVAILGVLAAVVIPRFTGLIGTAEGEASTTELEIVQTAMTACMASAGDGSIDAETTATQLGPTLGASLPAGLASGNIGTYLQTDTGWTYTWISDGTVTQVAKVS